MGSRSLIAPAAPPPRRTQTQGRRRSDAPKLDSISQILIRRLMKRRRRIKTIGRRERWTAVYCMTCKKYKYIL
jgi:hypothetical protein